MRSLLQPCILLGYESLSDLNISHRLPTFSPLKEALENAFNELKNDLQV